MSQEINIKTIFNQFETISLKETEPVNLTDRIESKYVFNSSLLSSILQDAKSDHKLVENNGIKLNSYLNEYYDTPDFKLYYSHHNGKLNRYKVRRRCYIDDQINYLEIKERLNNGRTVKKRFITKGDEVTKEEFAVLKTFLPNEFQHLQPIIKITYNRITLINKKLNERITIDLNTKANYKNKTFSFNNLVIAEVKQKNQVNSSFIELLKNKGFKKISISKYCFALSNLAEAIRTNNFKQTNSIINKLMF